ncbi:unnamed protein product [Chondrus crispus]|uniref:Uncharacterized protein n=1 Tax=Chondrus crispus TaxID=2769 RepID=R7QJQ4_CHOCR|nr:unnamed protein product [Chondrus crispus]CDF38324.1 unnamed protein product [Chondrus crispus]|eukprot:XP_005718209.1 unnamed protein product [Chondrus crispus]
MKLRHFRDASFVMLCPATSIGDWERGDHGFYNATHLHAKWHATGRLHLAGGVVLTTITYRWYILCDRRGVNSLPMRTSSVVVSSCQQRLR